MENGLTFNVTGKNGTLVLKSIHACVYNLFVATSNMQHTKNARLYVCKVEKRRFNSIVQKNHFRKSGSLLFYLIVCTFGGREVRQDWAESFLRVDLLRR